ncbi:1378_t:CDS:2, partial [Racocetra persica]
VHKTHYSIENETNNSTDISNSDHIESETDNSMDTYNSDSLEVINEVSTNTSNSDYVESESDNSTDIFNSDGLDVISKDSTDTSNSDHVESEPDNSTNIFNSDGLDVISEQNNNLTFDDQESANEYNLTFDTQSIVDKLNPIFDSQKISNTYKTGEFFGENMLENNIIIDEINKFQSNDSEYNSDNEIDNIDFSSTVYRDFIDIIHHTIETIKEYENLNSLNAKTYEALHKQYIKTPYRISNKCDINKQIMQKNIISENYQLKIKKKTRQFGKKYCTIPLHLLRSLVELYEQKEESITKILEGLRYLAPAINNYFKLIPSILKKNVEKSEATLILYESFALSNKEQIRATKNHYNVPMFSDVAVLMDSEQEFEVYDGYCFAKVLLLIRIVFKNASMFNLALVHWYNFKHPNILQNFINL